MIFGEVGLYQFPQGARVIVACGVSECASSSQADGERAYFFGLQQKRRRSSGRIKCGGKAFGGGKAETVLHEEQVSSSLIDRLRAFATITANGVGLHMKTVGSQVGSGFG